MPKVFPSRISNFIVADNIREEKTGKTTIVGGFNSGRIIFLANQKFPTVIPLAFLISFNDGEGDFVAILRVLGPNKKPITGNLSFGTIKKDANEGTQLIFNAPNFPVADVGQYDVEIDLDGKLYKESFSVGITSGNTPPP